MQIAKTWRQQSSNLRLVGNRCKECEAYVFPKQCFCSECGSEDLASYNYSGFGEILTVATVYEAPRGFGCQVPYVASLIKLDEGPVVAAMLADVEPGEATIGMRAQMVTRRISADGNEGPIVYGYKFSLVEE